MAAKKKKTSRTRVPSSKKKSVAAAKKDKKKVSKKTGKTSKKSAGRKKTGAGKSAVITNKTKKKVTKKKAAKKAPARKKVTGKKVVKKVTKKIPDKKSRVKGSGKSKKKQVVKKAVAPATGSRKKVIKKSPAKKTKTNITGKKKKPASKAAFSTALAAGQKVKNKKKSDVSNKKKKVGRKKKITTTETSEVKTAGKILTTDKNVIAENKKTTRKRKLLGKKASGSSIDRPESKPSAVISGSRSKTVRKINKILPGKKDSGGSLNGEENVVLQQKEEKVIPKTWMTDKELKIYHELLLRRRAELVGDVVSMEREALRGSSSGDLSHVPMHMADQGTDNYEREFTLQLAASERRMLAEIDTALHRIENRTYGVCEKTGKPISAARLEAKPWARFCIEVAREQERLNKSVW